MFSQEKPSNPERAYVMQRAIFGGKECTDHLEFVSSGGLRMVMKMKDVTMILTNIQNDRWVGLL